MFINLFSSSLLQGRHNMQKRRIAILIGVSIVGLGIVAAVTYFALRASNPNAAPLFSNDASILDRPTLEELPKQDASTADLTHVSSDLTPPTNSWVSGMVLQSKPNAVYPMPLSFQPSGSGFSAGLPTVTSAPITISGGHTPDVNVSINGAESFTLTQFDKTSAKLMYRNASAEIGSVTITQGSPFVFYRAATDSELRIDNTGAGTMDGDTYRFTKGEKEYVLSVHDQASLRVDGASVQATVPKGGLVTVYALPEAAEDALQEFAGNEIESVEVTNEIKDEQSLTAFSYETVNNEPTVVSFLPYLTVRDGTKVSVPYQSIYGDMNTYRGTTFTTSVPVITPDSTLDLTDISEEEKNKLIDDLRVDSQNISVEPQDTYFAGKQLARIANLLTLAKQLDQDEISERLQESLRTQLTKRLGASYFYYDTKLKGVAGQTKAFGSEDFNDHHFHYGYFIYAASMLAQYDTSFLEEYKHEVNLLVADIASYETYDEFPIMRTYDPYSTHSWAAGLSPFQDGNNQESSSEAINAWNAVAVWAKLINNKTLERNAQWMLSNETATAEKAWRNVDTSDDYLSNYSSPVASLSFGGKRTYSTFFSDESNTKLGIQLIPMSPVMEVFSKDGSAITNKLAAQDTPSNYNVALGDYLIMYLALEDKQAALEALDSQKDEYIDDGNSRAYLRAWIYAQ